MSPSVYLVTVTAIWTLSSKACGQTFSVNEGQRQRTFVGSVAESKELQESIKRLNLDSSLLRYTIFTKGNPHAGNFTIEESTGLLYTKDALDREILCAREEDPCSLQLDISAHNSDGFLQILNVQVIVNDMNDNQPTFPVNPVQLQIPESEPLNSTFPFRGALDKDGIGSNSEISYEMISPGAPFDMRIITLPDRTQDVGLVVAGKLDREKVSSYQVQILARDQGVPPRTGTVFVEVTITDVNDNYPEFTEEVYTVTIREDLPVETPVLQVLARDLDAGNNGNVTYRFSTSTQAFVIDAKTGRVFVGESVDFEQQQVYRLMIEASDGGTVPKTKRTLLIVNVSDVNDNAPEMSFNFLPGGDQAVIPEHSDLDTFVAFLSVADKDKGRNAEVQCNIEGDRYSLESQKPNEYIINLRTVLDRELQKEDYVGVICVDSGSPVMTSSSGFKLIVQDINDHDPVLSPTEYAITIEEGTDIGTVLLNVSATDKDEGENGRIGYQLEGDSASMFAVSDIGEFTVNLRPDRESQDSAVITLVAKDHGNPPNSATAVITVTITDINDEKPDFNRTECMFDISENLVGDTVIGQVTALDRDLGMGGEVQYRLSSNYDSQFFSVSKDSGIITAIQPLDRESQSIRELVVIAEDKGIPIQTSSVSVFVKVLDVNDNTPHITFPAYDNYSISIPSSLDVNSEILTIIAEDKDDGDNAKLSYEILEQERTPEYISINATSGRITLTKKFTSDVSVTFKLSLAVRDHGSPQRETWRNFSIFVSVVNDTAVLSESKSGQYNLVIVISVVAMTAVLSAVILATICIIRRRDNKQVEGDNVRPDLYDKPVSKRHDNKTANVGEIVRGEKVLESPYSGQNIYPIAKYDDAPLQSSSPKNIPPYSVQQTMDDQALEQQHLQYIRDFFPNDSGLDKSVSSFTDSNRNNTANWPVSVIQKLFKLTFHAARARLILTS